MSVVAIFDQWTQVDMTTPDSIGPVNPTDIVAQTDQFSSGPRTIGKAALLRLTIPVMASGSNTWGNLILRNFDFKTTCLLNPTAPDYLVTVSGTTQFQGISAPFDLFNGTGVTWNTLPPVGGWTQSILDSYESQQGAVTSFAPVNINTKFDRPGLWNLANYTVSAIFGIMMTVQVPTAQWSVGALQYSATSVLSTSTIKINDPSMGGDAFFVTTSL